MPVAMFNDLVGRKCDADALDTVLFVHIPKTGGRTADVLVRQNGYSVIELRGGDFFYLVDETMWLNHWPRTRYCLTGHFRLDHSIFRKLDQSFVTTTILRDPIDRMISNYNFTLRNMAAPWHEDVASGRMSFLDHVSTYLGIFGAQLTYFDTTGDGALHVTGSGSPQQCLENLINKVSFFGLLERFDEFRLLFGLLLGCQNILHAEARSVTARLPDNGTILLRKEELPGGTRDDLSRLLAGDIWFYEQAKAVYFDRIRKHGLDRIFADAMPLCRSAAEIAAQLQDVRDSAGLPAFRREARPSPRAKAPTVDAPPQSAPPPKAEPGLLRRVFRLG